MMSGGLIVLGFLFLAFLFRSAIVGDLAPVANARAPTPRVHLPPLAGAPRMAVTALPRAGFELGRKRGREAKPLFDQALEHVRAQGPDLRLLQSNATWKRVRLYRCVSCEQGSALHEGCEFERGLLAGAFEALTGELAKVHETACVSKGAPHCEFEVRHVPLVEVPV